MTQEELKNYIPKGGLEGFPKEIISRMLDCQEEQGNPRDITVFEKRCDVGRSDKGFEWDKTQEDWDFWHEVIHVRNFDEFFEIYPKKDNQDNSQYFRVGDKIISYITNKIGIVSEVKKHKIVVDYGNNDFCEYEITPDIERPFLLHYRDDYNYDVIDFNNLPKRQELKRWRAAKGKLYYFVNFNTKDWFCYNENKDDYDYIDNGFYNSGNYFQTEVEAQSIVQKLNTYFKQLIQEEHKRDRN